MPVFASVFANDRLHRRIRLQGRGIHTDCFAREQMMLLSEPNHEAEDLLMHFQRQTIPYARQALLIGCILTLFIAQKRPQRETVSAPPSDAPLRIHAFEITDEEHVKAVARRNGLATKALGIEGFAEFLGEVVEVLGFEQAIEFLKEHIPRRFGQPIGGNPEFLLPFTTAAPHTHRRSAHITRSQFKVVAKDYSHPTSFSTAC